MKRRLLAFLLAFVMTFSLVPVNTFAAEADAAVHYTNITTESGENVTVEYVETVVGEAAWGQSINTPYYHVTIPEGTEKVLLTYPESVNLVLSGDDGAVFFYRNTYPGQSEIALGGALTVATNNDGSKTVTIPVENFMLSTDGSVAVGMAYYVDGENQSAAEFFDFTYAALTHAVTLTSGEGYTLTGEATAEDGKDYTFTVTEDGNYTYNTTVTVGGKAYTLGTPENGKYTIPGTDIKGDIVISVTKTVKPSSVVSVTKPDYVKGSDIATKGQDYTFTVDKEEGYDYSEPTVKVGDVDVTDKLVKNGDGSYTIPGSTITGNITIEVTKTAAVAVDVAQYLTLDGKVMYLVTASGTLPEGQVAKYDGMSMFWSEKYNAYAYLVISADNLEAVKAEAAAKVKVAEGTSAGTVDYSGDVNGTGLTDVNDAQLTYDMYNTKYSSFDVVSMLKFLNADVSGDKKGNTADATAIVNLIK